MYFPVSVANASLDLHLGAEPSSQRAQVRLRVFTCLGCDCFIWFCTSVQSRQAISRNVFTLLPRDIVMKLFVGRAAHP